MKKILIILILAVCALFASCSDGNMPSASVEVETVQTSETEITTETYGNEKEWSSEMSSFAAEPDIKEDMILKIDNVPVPVTWEDNASTEALKELCKTRPLTISMSMYGGFEQVGPIGQELPCEDEQITTQSGDIVLYSEDRIVLFYGSNSWSYTRLGRMELSEEELTDILGNEEVVIEISVT